MNTLKKPLNGGNNSAKKRGQVQAQASDISIALSEIINHVRELENPRDRQLLLSFRGNTAANIHQSLIKYLKDESFCTAAVMLSIYPGDIFMVFSTDEPLSKTKFPGLSLVLSNKLPVLLDKNCEPWKEIFSFLPKVVVLIPANFNVTKTNTTTVDVVAALGFEGDLPNILLETYIWTNLIECCRLTTPLLINIQRYEEIYSKVTRTREVLQAITEAESRVFDIGSCINSIGLELQSLFGGTHTVVFIIQDQFLEAKMLKYCTLGGGKIDDQCPHRELHSMEEISQAPDTPIGWTASYRKCLRANSPSDLVEYKLPSGPIHSVGACIQSNILCIPIPDFTLESSLVVELSGKAGGFSPQDEMEANLFSNRMSCIVSSTVLLDYKKKAGKRSHITNEVLNNIKTVRFIKVKQLLDLKFRYSHSFLRKFFNFNYTLRQLPAEQLPGVIIYMFTEMGFVSRWKIRRTTLIRFILSIKQGYKENPYHNWKHACTVTHFAFLVLRKSELQKHGILRDIEVFAFMVACLCHDVDHRGINNHFSTSPEADSYHLYRLEESVMERHHVAVALQLLSSDEFNILEGLSDNDYKEFVDLFQWSILATDLGKYLQTRASLFVKLKTFDKTQEDSRRTLMAVLMTVCDLCETVKPWNDYIHTVKSIFSEFFAQGDDEIRLGFNPSPMMDKKVAYIPYIETKFINDIVRPAYEIIAELLPKTAECLQTIDYFKELWLVATKVFDDNTHMTDPLEIIDLLEMKEESLKILVNPALEKHVHRIRQSQVMIQPLVPKDFHTSIMPYGNFETLGDEEDIQKKSCRTWFVKLFCCFKCRRKALHDAAFITRFHQETEFLELRSESYEKERTVDEVKTARPSESTRSRIQSLINPEAIKIAKT